MTLALWLALPLAAAFVSEPRRAQTRVQASLEFDPTVSPHEYGAKRRASVVGVIMVDHGSKRAASNEQFEALAATYGARLQGEWFVRAAHMELASPSIEESFDACVAAGCDLVVCHPYFLGNGRHSMTDIPELLAAASARHPGVTAVMTPPVGASARMLDLVHASVSASVEATNDDSAGNFENSFFGSINSAMDELKAL